MTTTQLESKKFDLALAPIRIGRVRLNVRDLPLVSGFYQDALGFVETDSGVDTVTLGTADTPLLELVRKPVLAPRDPRSAGLFHTAFLLPDRSDLGRWLAHVHAHHIPLQGASDHIVSEAIYLADPEGNGIEVYADRPVSNWQSRNGEIVMATEPLDIRDLMHSASGEVWNSAPTGTIVGHMHLQVGDTVMAEQFWSGIMGLDVTNRYPGATFFGAGGYHHQIAANTWNSRGAAARTEERTGLAGFEVLVSDSEHRDAIASRAAVAGRLVSRTANTVIISDPWNNRVTVKM